jgi:RNA polymerase primary sigma factor
MVSGDEAARQLAQLIETAKGKGYVLFDEIDDVLREDYTDGRELDILSEFERAGIEVLEQPRLALENEIEARAEVIHPEQDEDSSEWACDDPVAVYLREMDAVAELAVQDEIDLAQRIRAGGRDAEMARKQLAEANLRLVVSIARHYADRGVHILDLIQAGNTGLLKALYQFDFANRCKFATYATWLVRRALRRATLQT